MNPENKWLSRLIGLKGTTSYFYVGWLTYDVLLANFDKSAYTIDKNKDVIFNNEEDYIAAMLKYADF